MDKKTEYPLMTQETVARTTTPDLQVPTASCLIEGNPEPCEIVIVGASGDLTSRKLIPALYNLYQRNVLPKPFLIIGCSRTNMDDQEFRNNLKEALSNRDDLDLSQWDAFGINFF